MQQIIIGIHKAEGLLVSQSPEKNGIVEVGRNTKRQQDALGDNVPRIYSSAFSLQYSGGKEE